MSINIIMKEASQVKTQKMTVILRIVFLILITAAVPAFADTITANDDCTVRGSTNYNNSPPEFGLLVKNSDDISWVEFDFGSETVSQATLTLYQHDGGVTSPWTIVVKGAEYNFNETTFTGTDTSSWATVGSIPSVQSIEYKNLDITSFYNNNLGNTVTLQLGRSSQPAGNGPIFEDKEGTRTGNGATYGPKITYTVDDPPPPPSDIPGVFNTGVDASGDALGDEVLDPHWTLTTSADPTYNGPETYTVKSDEFPIPPWIANTSNSKWICPRQDETVVEDGAYVYQLQFDLTGYEPDSANMTGQYSVDDGLTDVKINGVSTGISGTMFDTWHSFSISSGFATGINTLEFFVNNGGTSATPSGLRVELTVTANAITAKASNPNPTNTANDVAIDTDLSWTAGIGATSHDVYFGTNQAAVIAAGRLLADINGDGPISYLDIAVINEQWLTSPGSLDPSADVDGDGDVDLTDYAIFAYDWLEPADAAFKGNQPLANTTYFLPTLSEDITYYWRIDEVNNVDSNSPYTGDIWSFSTSLAPLEISNLNPSAYNIVYDALNTGQLLYVDRTVGYASVPATYQGMTFIQTANDDKQSSGSSFVSFDINYDCTIYVAHDDRLSTKPSWLTTNFTDTGDDLVDDSGESVHLSLYEKVFSAGTVTLGGNEGGGQPDCSMYTVVIEGPNGPGGEDPPDGSITFPGATWESKTPSELGLDSTKLDQFAANIGGQGIIVRQGYVVKTWGDTANKSDWASAAKPVISTMLFFAVDEALLSSVNELIEDHGWDLIAKDETMTFYHLANMTSGYHRGEAPGGAWAYNDYAINLYAKTLFDNVYGTTANTTATNASRLGALTFQDGSIFSSRGGYGIETSVRDFARIGWLWCNYGNWDGTQLLPRSYFDDYMQAHVSSGTPRTSTGGTDYLGVGTYGGGDDQTADGPGVYGFNWWCNPSQSNWPDAPADTVQGNGHWGAEVVTVIPSLSLVVAYKGGATRGHSTGSSSSDMNQDLKLLADGCPPYSPGAPSGTIIVDPTDSSRMVYSDTYENGRLKPVCFAGPGDPEDFFYNDTANNLSLLTSRGARCTYITAVLQDFGGGNPGTGTALDTKLTEWEGYITTLENAGVITVFFFFDDTQGLTGNWQELVDKCVAKFKHHELLIWSVAEEYGEALSTSQVSQVAARIKSQDDNNHVVGVHQNNGNSFDFLGDSNLDMFLMQLNYTTPGDLHNQVKNSNANGTKILNMAEASDHAKQTRTAVRQWNWASIMGGASAVQVLWMGRNSDPADWNHVDKYNDCARLMDFMESTNLNPTTCRDDLARGNTDYVLADPRC